MATDRTRYFDATQIKREMAGRGKTIEVLEKTTGVSNATISKIRNGQNVNIEKLYKILEELDLQITIQPKVAA